MPTIAEETETLAAKLGEPIEAVLVAGEIRSTDTEYREGPSVLLSWEQARPMLEAMEQTFGSVDGGRPFVAWTRSFVIFIVGDFEQDSVEISAVPRHPTLDANAIIFF